MQLRESAESAAPALTQGKTGLSAAQLQQAVFGSAFRSAFSFALALEGAGTLALAPLSFLGRPKAALGWEPTGIKGDGDGVWSAPTATSRCPHGHGGTGSSSTHCWVCGDPRARLLCHTSPQGFVFFWGHFQRFPSLPAWRIGGWHRVSAQGEAVEAGAGPGQQHEWRGQLLCENARGNCPWHVPWHCTWAQSHLS